MEKINTTELCSCGQQAKYKSKNGKLWCGEYQIRCPMYKWTLNKMLILIYKKMKKTSPIKTTELCSYGCGQIAKFRLGNGNICCMDNYIKCNNYIKNLNLKKLTYERLKELLYYNPTTGIFKWNINTGNKQKKGKFIGTTNKNVYITIWIDGKSYNGHRLAWFYTYGYMSEYEVDHIDRIKSNNRISNLREVSHSCNLRNTKQYTNNKSGVKGVFFNKQTKKWIANITINKITYNLGCYNKKIDAAIARYEGEIKYNFDECNKSETTSYLYIQNYNKNEKEQKKHTIIKEYKY